MSYDYVSVGISFQVFVIRILQFYLVMWLLELQPLISSLF